MKPNCEKAKNAQPKVILAQEAPHSEQYASARQYSSALTTRIARRELGESDRGTRQSEISKNLSLVNDYTSGVFVIRRALRLKNQ